MVKINHLYMQSSKITACTSIVLFGSLELTLLAPKVKKQYLDKKTCPE